MARKYDGREAINSLLLDVVGHGVKYGGLIWGVSEIVSESPNPTFVGLAGLTYVLGGLITRNVDLYLSRLIPDTQGGFDEEAVRSLDSRASGQDSPKPTSS